MPHEPNDIPKMVGFLIRELFKDEEIFNKTFKELSEDGSKRMEFVHSTFYAFHFFTFLEFCAKRCNVLSKDQYKLITRPMSNKVSKIKLKLKK